MRLRHRLNVPASELAGRRQASDSAVEPPQRKTKPVLAGRRQAQLSRPGIGRFAPRFLTVPPLTPNIRYGTPSKSDPPEGPGSVTRIHKSFKRQKKHCCCEKHYRKKHEKNSYFFIFYICRTRHCVLYSVISNMGI